MRISTEAPVSTSDPALPAVSGPVENDEKGAWQSLSIPEVRNHVMKEWTRGAKGDIESCGNLPEDLTSGRQR